jgi:thioredoxin 1
MRPLIFFMMLMTTELSFPQDPGGYKCITISADDFYSNIKLKPEIKIIDVRMRPEFRKERIKNAINIPVSKLPCKKAEELSRETAIYLYCTSGVRSCHAAAKFNEMGFKYIFSLEGGINAWKKADLPVIHGRKGIPEPYIPLSPYPPIAPKSIDSK